MKRNIILHLLVKKFKWIKMWKIYSKKKSFLLHFVKLYIFSSKKAKLSGSSAGIDVNHKSTSHHCHIISINHSTHAIDQHEVADRQERLNKWRQNAVVKDHFFDHVSVTLEG